MVQIGHCKSIILLVTIWNLQNNKMLYKIWARTLSLKIFSDSCVQISHNTTVFQRSQEDVKEQLNIKRKNMELFHILINMSN